jgi:hypothetical protein
VYNIRLFLVFLWEKTELWAILGKKMIFFLKSWPHRRLAYLSLKGRGEAKQQRLCPQKAKNPERYTPIRVS